MEEQNIIQRKRAGKRWIVLYTIASMASIIYECLVELTSEGYEIIAYHRFYGRAIGALLVWFLIPWIISGIHRLVTKKPSGENLFIIYYLVIIIWIVVGVWARLSVANYYGINIIEGLSNKSMILNINSSTFLTVLIMFFVIVIFNQNIIQQKILKIS